MAESGFNDSNTSRQHTSVHQTNTSYLNIPQEQKGAFLVGYTFIMLFSLTGNSLVLIAVYKNTNRRMRTVSNFFVVNMSSSDLLITVCNVPKAISSIISDGTWPLGGHGTAGYHLCRITKLLWFMSIDVSLLSLIAISINRFLLVFFPFKRFISPKVAYVIILSIWLMSLIFAGSLMPGVDIYKHQMATKIELYCSLKFSEDIAIGTYLIVHFTVFIVWPLLTMILLYSAIALKLCCRKLPGNQSVNRQELNDKLNHKVLAMLVTVVILFSVCWVPFWVFTLPHMKLPLIYMYITESIAYTNCALNPLLYATFNEVFRKAFKEILQSCFFSGSTFGQQLPLHNRVFIFGMVTNNNNSKTRDTKTSSAFTIS